jgi:glycosyltransferase involved in cell wall biosynthesis
MGTMKVSIITVSYNSEKTIEDTIKSVLSQDYPNIEYVIIDGASKDSTLQIVEKYQDKIAHVSSEKDKGIYDAMNKGIALATGDIIGILNSDDFYADSTVISSIVAQFTPTIQAVYADLVYVDANDTNRITRLWKSGNYKQGDFKKGWMPPHPTFFVKSECYQKYGNYSLQLKSAADYELMLRLIHKEQIKINYLPKVIVKMRTGGASNASLKNRIRANKEDRMAWQMNGLKPGLFTFIRKPISKIIQFIRK